MQVFPHLPFNGTCEEAFGFYQRCLGGEITAMMKWGGSPMEQAVTADWHGKIMHACLRAEGNRIIGSDAPPGRYQKPTSLGVTISLPTPADADRVFTALSEGAEIGMPMQETFFATRFGMLTDRYGIPWMVLSEKTP
jgi:PhnB protein